MYAFYLHIRKVSVAYRFLLTFKKYKKKCSFISIRYHRLVNRIWTFVTNALLHGGCFTKNDIILYGKDIHEINKIAGLFAHAIYYLIILYEYMSTTWYYNFFFKNQKCLMRPAVFAWTFK